MRRSLRIGLGLVAFAGAAVTLLGAAGYARWDRKFEAPEPELRASADPAVIARGRYLAYGPAHCAACHTHEDMGARLDAGEEVPLSGGRVFELPLGRIYTANLTPDVATGIGRWSDGQLARTLRHGVRPDGRAAVPFMEFQNLSDEDVVALISFLRSQKAVRNAVPDHELNAMGRMVMAYLIKPQGPETVPPVHTPAEEATVERGEYLANRVAGCAGCHTRRSPVDGSYLAPRFSGGGTMKMDSDPTKVLVTPNLTPDPATGHIHEWTEDGFVARFRAGRLVADSHMPWGPFGRMSDTDLRAIYRYLRTLEPVENATGAIIQDAPKK